MSTVYKITDWTGFSLMVNDRVEVIDYHVCLPVGEVFRIKWIYPHDGEFDICLDTKPKGIYNNAQGDWPVSHRDVKLARRPWYNELLNFFSK